MKCWVNIAIVVFIGCVSSHLYAKEFVDRNYKQLYPKMDSFAIKKTLNWRPIPNSSLWEDMSVRRQLSFLASAQILVFTSQGENPKKNMIVVELDENHLLKNVFLVFETMKSREVKFLWPEKGEYEHHFKNIKIGDNIEKLMRKIGWRPPAYSKKNEKGEDVVFYVYKVRETTVYLGVNNHSGKIESLIPFIDADVMLVIDGKSVGDPEEWFNPPHLPLPEIGIPKEVDVEYPINF